MFSQHQYDEPNLFGNPSNQSGMGNQGRGGQGGGGMGDLFGGLGDIFGSIFGGQGDAYKDAQKQYEKYMNQAQSYQNPFFNAGQRGLGSLQEWLGGMRNPSKFINNQMDKYQESPYARNLQQQAMNAGMNMGSASGLLGSTPLMQQMQQNAGNISSQDQQQWLQNVLGINSLYGQGQAGLAGMGQDAANNLSGISNRAGQDMSQLAYNQRRAEQQRWPQAFAGLSKIFGGGSSGNNGGGGNNNEQMLMKLLPFLMG